MPREQVSSSVPGLEHILIELSLSQSEFARQLGVRPFAVNSWVSGLRKPPSQRVASITKILCCEANDVFGVPTKSRLASIRAAYHQREADRAREEARAAS